MELESQQLRMQQSNNFFFFFSPQCLFQLIWPASQFVTESFHLELEHDLNLLVSLYVANFTESIALSLEMSAIEDGFDVNII